MLHKPKKAISADRCLLGSTIPTSADHCLLGVRRSPASPSQSENDFTPSISRKASVGKQ